MLSQFSRNNERSLSQCLGVNKNDSLSLKTRTYAGAWMTFSVARETGLLPGSGLRKLNSLHYLRPQSPLAPIQQWSRFQLPSLPLQEHLMKSLDIGDKIFASCWLDNSTVMCTTKNGTATLFDTVTGDRRIMELPLSNRADCEASGSHFITKSPCARYLVTGARNPVNLALFDMDELVPRKLFLNGHEDWVFDAVFYDSFHFVTGCRDGSIALWDVRDRNGTVHGTPFATHRQKRIAHQHRCRCLAMAPSGVLITSSPNKFLKTWDVERLVATQQSDISALQEVVTLAVHANSDVVAIGHYAGVVLISLQTNTVVKELIKVGDTPLFSVRSVRWQGDLLSIGTGNGMLCFYDFRAHKFLPMKEPSIASSMDLLEPGANQQQHQSDASAHNNNNDNDNGDGDDDDDDDVGNTSSRPRTRRRRESRVAGLVAPRGLNMTSTDSPSSTTATTTTSAAAAASVQPRTTPSTPSGSKQGSTTTDTASGPVFATAAAVASDSRADTLSRAAQYVRRSRQVERDVLFRKISQGHVLHDDNYNRYFSPGDQDIAVYTHQWSPGGNSIFLGGGPLACGLTGCYASVWRV